MADERKTLNEHDGGGVSRHDPFWVAVRSLVPIFLWAVLLILVLRYFSAVQFILFTFLAAAALSATLHPIVDRLPGPVPMRAIGALLAVVLVVSGILFLVGWAMYEPVQRSIENWPATEERINDALKVVSGWLGLAGDITFGELLSEAGGILTGESMTDWMSAVFGTVSGAALAVLVVFIAAAYLLSQPPDSLKKPLVAILPHAQQDPTMAALCDLSPQLRWWAIGTLFSMTVIGITFGLGFWIIGLEFALVLAVFAAVAQIVPTFGPLLTLIVALLVALTQGTFQVVGVFVVYVAAQGLESYLLTPLVMKKAVKIPPVITLFSVIFWGNLFGVPGLILAIPIDLTIWAFLKHHIVERHPDA
ncbi:MAG: AI-2E family transporter [Phycisphaerae bacterium]